MRISFATTNPCHLWDLAVELSKYGVLADYLSGYPKWKLNNNKGIPVRTHSVRTLMTYALYSKVPESMRPSNSALFRWQDKGFDRWVSRVLKVSDFHHGIPGQCVEAFRSAKSLGICTVLNHATGPKEVANEIMRPEYQRVGLQSKFREHLEGSSEVPEEIELADYHCCASSVVAEQLVSSGVSESRLMIVPYGADPGLWHSQGRDFLREEESPMRILFAGQLCLRKGLRFLLKALERGSCRKWKLDCYGPVLDETELDRKDYRGDSAVRYHGACSQFDLAEVMRKSDLLVLPSLEEGFGLVVVQALACGVPCIVSDAVGAKDLIRHRGNGSVVPVGDVEALLEELKWWAANPREVCGDYSWKQPAEDFVGAHQRFKEVGSFTGELERGVD